MKHGILTLGERRFRTRLLRMIRKQLVEQLIELTRKD